MHQFEEKKQNKTGVHQNAEFIYADSFKNDTFISAVYAKRYRVTVQCSTFIV